MHNGENTDESDSARIARLRAKVELTRSRAERTTAGRLARRITELAVMNQALLLGALGLMLIVPALLALNAISPVGADHGAVDNFVKRMGLSNEAARDIRQLFAGQDTVGGAGAVISSLFTVVFAFGWPATLQRAYEVIWALPALGRWEVWRPLLWLLGVAPVVVAANAAAGITGQVGAALLCLPLVFAWAWWQQHLLLGGRIAWSELLPGAVATAIALFGLNLTMSVYLSRAIVSNYNDYGPIGGVLALMSWLVGFGAVMVGAPLAGRVWHQRHLPEGENSSSHVDDVTPPERDLTAADIESTSEATMSTLIAIGYPDEATAAAASEEAQRLAADLIIEPDAIAVIRRDREGKFHVETNHHAVGGGASWGMFWGFLFGLLFFIPIFGMAVGAGLGALLGKVEKSGIDKAFQQQVRDMLQPGTSALFLVVEKITTDKAVEALSQYGGTVLKSNLSQKAEAELQAELHGSTVSS